MIFLESSIDPPFALPFSQLERFDNTSPDCLPFLLLGGNGLQTSVFARVISDGLTIIGIAMTKPFEDRNGGRTEQVIIYL
jgi:hypothetical protein